MAVNVIAAFPTYDSHIGASRNEQFRNVRIQRIWSTRLNKNKKIGKVINSLTFFFSALWKSLTSDRIGPLLIVSNPPFLPLVGFFCKIFQQRNYIFLVHDVYPDIAVQLGYLSRYSIVTRIWNWINRIIYSNASQVIVLSNSMKEVVLKKMSGEYRNALEKKMTIIHNWADADYIKPVAKSENLFLKENGLLGKFIVLYSGNMGLFHELEMIIEVANKINDNDIQFVFIGEGGKKKTLESLVEQYGLTNVSFFPYQDQSVLPFSLTAASVSLVTLEQNIEGLAMPSKLYTTMAAGNPIIVVCDEQSDLRKIVHDAQCGFQVNHHDNDEMIRTLLLLKDRSELGTQLGSNARKYFEQHYTLEKAVVSYHSVIEKIQ